MAENLGYIPARVVAGETIWIAAANTLQSAQDIVIAGISPASGYTLAYQFAAPTPISVAASANGNNTGWTLTVTAAQTLLWRAGSLAFAALATDSNGKVFAVDGGAINVVASPLATSQYAAALVLIDAAILTFATGAQRSFTLGDMSVTYGSLQELLDLRNHYRAEIARETSTRPKRIIRARFT